MEEFTNPAETADVSREEASRLCRHKWILRIATAILAAIPLILVFVFDVGTD